MIFIPETVLGNNNISTGDGKKIVTQLEGRKEGVTFDNSLQTITQIKNTLKAQEKACIMPSEYINNIKSIINKRLKR